MKYINKYPLLFILLIAFVLRLVNLHQSFWLDEVAQVIESARPFSQQFDIAADFHPPGFHLILFFWMKVNHSEIWIRMLPVLFGLGSVFALYHTTKALGYQKLAPYTSLLLALNPYHIWYSQETRPYSMFVFTSLLATYMLITRKWRGYAVSVVILLYSLYFAPFVLVGHIVYSVVCNRKELKHFFISLFVGCLLFLPWIPSFLEQLRIGTGGAFSGWTSVVSVAPLKALPLMIAKFLFGRGTFLNKSVYAMAVLPGTFVFIAAFYYVWKSREHRKVLILFVVPLLMALIVSFAVPVIAPQRLIFLLPYFLVLIAIGVARLAVPWNAVAIGILFVTQILGIAQYYTDPTVQREQWRQAVGYIEAENPKAVSLFAFPEPFAPYYWYTNGIVEGYGYAKNFSVTHNDLSSVATRIRNKERVYLFQYLTGLTDPDDTVKRTLMYGGFSQTTIKNFPGVGFIYVYDRK